MREKVKGRWFEFGERGLHRFTEEKGFEENWKKKSQILFTKPTFIQDEINSSSKN